MEGLECQTKEHPCRLAIGKLMRTVNGRAGHSRGIGGEGARIREMGTKGEGKGHQSKGGGASMREGGRGSAACGDFLTLLWATG